MRPFIIELNGGLGNQMFQYAFGRALSEKFKVPFMLSRFLLDHSSLMTSYTPRNYELDVFELDVETTNQNVFRKSPARIFYLLNRSLNKRFGLPMMVKSNVITENQGAEGIEDLTRSGLLEPGLCFSGYWQSEKYFKSIEYEIRSDFVFQNALDSRNYEVKKRIETTSSVGIHVRRGDYVTNSSAAKHHGTCSLDYYRKSVEKIRARVENPYFFVFSDDFNWVKENITNLGKCEYVDWNTGNNSFIDMQLMSCCKSNIIANSSFSWWGAWLNSNKGKQVIAPRQWFASASKNNNCPNLIPLGWERL